MVVSNKEASDKSYQERRGIPLESPVDSLEHRQRYGLQVTGTFFDPNEDFGNLWLGATFDEVGEKVQNAIGQLDEKPELRPVIQKYLVDVLHQRDSSVLRVWQSQSNPQALLAEIKLADNNSQLGWFDSSYIKVN